MRISDWSSDVCSSDLRCSTIGWDLDAWQSAGGSMAALHPRKTLACALSPICLVPVRTRLHRRLSGGVRDYLILCCAVDAGEWRRDGGWSWIGGAYTRRSEEHTSELQSLMRISYAV